GNGWVSQRPASELLGCRFDARFGSSCYFSVETVRDSPISRRVYSLNPHRVLSLVADATKVRRVCKPSEFKALMTLVITPLRLSRSSHGQNTDNTSSSRQRRVVT